MDPVASKPLVFRQGEDVAFSVTIKNKEDGSPRDLTGWTFESHLRSVPKGQLLATWVPDNANPTTGIVIFRLSSATTFGIPATPADTTYGTDGWAIEPNGTRHALPRRAVTVSATFTHS